MFRLGIGTPGTPNHPLHHPKFEANETAIAIGVTTLAYAIVQYWETFQLPSPDREQTVPDSEAA
jgi:metal-dependent amidase/aminoacylase/carboxypeptidase family protein